MCPDMIVPCHRYHGPFRCSTRPRSTRSRFIRAILAGDVAPGFIAVAAGEPGSFPRVLGRRAWHPPPGTLPLRVRSAARNMPFAPSGSKSSGLGRGPERSDGAAMEQRESSVRNGVQVIRTVFCGKVGESDPRVSTFSCCGSYLFIDSSVGTWSSGLGGSSQETSSRTRAGRNNHRGTGGSSSWGSSQR